MGIQLRPAVLGVAALMLALLVGVRSPAWGFRLLVVLASVALLSRLLRRR